MVPGDCPTLESVGTITGGEACSFGMQPLFVGFTECVGEKSQEIRARERKGPDV